MEKYKIGDKVQLLAGETTIVSVLDRGSEVWLTLQFPNGAITLQVVKK